MRADPLVRPVLSVLFISTVAAGAAAQCNTEWLLGAGDGFPREGQVNAGTMWDPDGPGPATERLVIAGAFRTATNIATFDPVTGDWGAIAGGVLGEVHDLTAMPNGDLIAVGDFVSGARRRITRWNGVSWTALGFGVGTQATANSARAVTALPNGDIIVGGGFATASGVAVSNIARWDGVAWSAMGSGVDSAVYALTTLPNGDVIAGGSFSTAGGVAASKIARWDGSTWSPMATGMPAISVVLSLQTMPNGDVVAGGAFTTAGGVAVANIARWDGASWSALGSGTNARVSSLAVVANGDLIVGGEFTTAGGVAANHTARWGGAAWSAVGAGVSLEVKAVAALPNGDVMAAGVAATAASTRIACFDGLAWRDLGTGFGRGTTSSTVTVDALLALPNGNLVATGSFWYAGDFTVSSIAQWDGSSWAPMGTGLSGYPQWGLALTTMSNGDIVVGGQFGTTPTSPKNIARWDGAVWSPLGSGIPGLGSVVQSLVTLPNGDIVAGGLFTQAGGVLVGNIARWDGVSWTAFGSGINGGVRELVVLPNGDLVAGGVFTQAGGVAVNNIARWDGTSWSALGTGVAGSVTSMVSLPGGDLIVGGTGFPGRIARWDGSTWSALGYGLNGLANALAILPNGDLAVGGTFTMAGGVTTERIARWDGTSWSALCTQMDGGIYALATMANGELAVAGYFATVEGRYSAGIARLVSTCPATATVAPTPCVGSAGPLTLVADTLPWVGSTFRATAAGMPPVSIGFTVTGFSTTSLPLSTVFSQALPGCDLLVSPDAVQVMIASAGEVRTQLVLPSNAALTGFTFHQQVVAIEVDAQLTFLEVASTNALSLTIGVF
jgi:hypothetical protein